MWLPIIHRLTMPSRASRLAQEVLSLRESIATLASEAAALNRRLEALEAERQVREGQLLEVCERYTRLTARLVGALDRQRRGEKVEPEDDLYERRRRGLLG